RRDPLDGGRRAVRAARARGMPEAPAPAAALEAKLAARAEVPELLRVDVGMEGREVGQHRHLRRSSELVGRFEGPAVTSATSASATCDVDVPRSWRTASITCVMPRR